MKIETKEQLALTLAAIISSYGRQIRAAGDKQAAIEARKWAELTNACMLIVFLLPLIMFLTNDDRILIIAIFLGCLFLFLSNFLWD